MKAEITKLSPNCSDKHFKKRQLEKNALAISSEQSKKVDNYNTVVENYKNTLREADLTARPKYWGGYAFVPYYFEFWEGQRFRLNSRDVFELNNGNWDHYNLQP